MYVEKAHTGLHCRIAVRCEFDRSRRSTAPMPESRRQHLSGISRGESRNRLPLGHRFRRAVLSEDRQPIAARRRNDVCYSINNMTWVFVHMSVYVLLLSSPDSNRRESDWPDRFAVLFSSFPYNRCNVFLHVFPRRKKSINGDICRFRGCLEQF